MTQDIAFGNQFSATELVKVYINNYDIRQDTIGRRNQFSATVCK